MHLDLVTDFIAFTKGPVPTLTSPLKPEHTYRYKRIPGFRCTYTLRCENRCRDTDVGEQMNEDTDIDTGTQIGIYRRNRDGACEDGLGFCVSD